MSEYEAGRETDALVAERLGFGPIEPEWPCGWNQDSGEFEPAYTLDEAARYEAWPERDRVYFVEYEHFRQPVIVPRYSTAIADAWVLVEKIRDLGGPGKATLRLVVYPYDRTYATFHADAEGEIWQEANGEHATPLAITRAFLAATEPAP